MIAARQFSNTSASLNPFNSIPQAQPTATQSGSPAIASTDGSKPALSTAQPTLPSSINDGILPEQASVFSSIFGALRPSNTQTDDISFPSEIATSIDGDFSSAFSTGSPMASLSPTSGQSMLPTGTITRSSIVPFPSNLFSKSASRSDATYTSITTSGTSSAIPITTLTSFTTVSASSSSSSSSTTSSSSTSTSSSSSSQTSSLTSVGAARATATPPDVSTQNKSSLSSGAIAGITFASAASVALLAFLLFLCLRRRKTHKPPSIYPEEAYLYDPPITPPSGLAQSAQSTQPWMREYTAYHPTSQLPPVHAAGAPMIPNSPPMMSHSPPTRAVTPEGYERVGLLGTPEGQQDLAMLGAWPSLRGRNSVSYRPLGTGRGYRLPAVHEDQHERIENDPQNPFRDQHVI